MRPHGARREQDVGNYGGNCGNVNVKGTNECCAAGTKDTNNGSELSLVN